MINTRAPIVVVGAGLVGTVIACYLARRGYRVDLYERRADPRQVPPPPGRSVHLVISARGWRALTDIGAADAVRRISQPLRGRTIHRADGETTFQPYGRDDQYIYAVSRTRLNEVLIEFADSHPNIHLYFDARCLGVDVGDGTATFEHPTKGRIQARGAFTIGADGVSSAVREAMLEQPGYESTRARLDWGYRELAMPANGGPPLDPSTLHVWPRGRFMLTAFPNLDESFTASIFLPFEGEPSFASIRDEAVLHDFFDRNFPDARPLLPTLRDDFFARRPSSLITLQCWPWTAGGHVMLIGDAAHSVVPFYGQGMNAGLEDCTTFDRCIEERGEDWPAVLASYERLRKPNTDALAALSLKNFAELSDHVGDAEFHRRKRIERRLGESFPERFVPMYSMVAFSDIPYARALQLGQKQDRIVDRLLTIDGIEERWDTLQQQVSDILNQSDR